MSTAIGIVIFISCCDRSSTQKTTSDLALFEAQLLADSTLIAYATIDLADLELSKQIRVVSVKDANYGPILLPKIGGLDDIHAVAGAEQLFCSRIVREAKPGVSRAMSRISVVTGEIQATSTIRHGPLRVMSPSEIAVFASTKPGSSEGSFVPHFFRFEGQEMRPTCRFEHPDGNCTVFDMIPISEHIAMLHVRVNSDTGVRHECVAFDFFENQVGARVETGIEGKNLGVRLASDPTRGVMVVANRQRVELRRLPTLEKLGVFDRPVGSHDCIAVSAGGCYVAMGGGGLWVWSATEHRINRLHDRGKEALVRTSTVTGSVEEGTFAAEYRNYLMQSRGCTRFLAFLGSSMHCVEITGAGVLQEWDIESEKQIGKARHLW